MDSPNQQAADRIKQSNSILVTVSNNPSVDQLAACIALTLIFNKMGKHATAVFSGEVPSTIEFLKPEETFEKTTDSLRDFIIALDKSKADKLRYKVEDRVVRIFITPYRTSITQDDLEFSQGDPSVDVVLALGVHNQVDIDQAITVHGRILHDATVITINTMSGGELGGINWVDNGASSLSEMATLLSNLLGQNLLDSQTATALLTGIVSATGRFSNPQTYPQTMTVSAELLAAGADQQLVAAKLDAAVPEALPIELPPVDPVETLEVPHADQSDLELARPLHHDDQTATKVADIQSDDDADAVTQQIHIDEQGSLISLTPKPEAPVAGVPVTPVATNTGRESEAPKIMMEPPVMGSPATNVVDTNQPPLGSYLSGSVPTDADAGEEAPSGGSIRNNGFIVGSSPLPGTAAPASQPSPVFPAGQTLSDIERNVHSTHLSETPGNVAGGAMPVLGPQSAPIFPAEPEVTPPVSGVDVARDAVSQAVGESTAPVIGQFDSQSVQLTHDGSAAQPVPQPVQTVSPTNPVEPWTLPTDGPSPVGNAEPIVVQPYPQTSPFPSPVSGAPVISPQVFDPNAPPPVPPPMMPPIGQY